MSKRTISLASSSLIMLATALVACGGSQALSAESARARVADVCGRGAKSCEASFDAAACNQKLGGVTSDERVRARAQ